MLHIKEALRAQLIAENVNAAGHIYDTVAPPNTPYPYVVFTLVGGGDDNQSALETRRELWQVKAVADDHAAAHTLAESIRAALHGQPLAITGWRHLWTVHTEPVWMVESVGRGMIYHAGGTFRVQYHRASAA